MGSASEHRSRWPLVTAVGATALYAGAALGLLALAADVFPLVLALSLGAVGAVVLASGLVGWVYEGFVAGRRKRTPESGGRYRGAIVAFLLTDVATFSAGFVYYLFVRAGPWPPGNLPTLLGSLVLVNTLVLLCSSVTLHGAHRALERDDRARFVALLGVTVALGVGFLTGQAVEYSQFVLDEGFGLDSGAFGSAFYGLTGLHGLHVALGVVFLAIVFVRALRDEYGPENDVSVGTASLYWHFVDAVWVVLVALLYVGATVGS